MNEMKVEVNDSSDNAADAKVVINAEEQPVVKGSDAKLSAANANVPIPPPLPVSRPSARRINVQQQPVANPSAQELASLLRLQAFLKGSGERLRASLPKINADPGPHDAKVNEIKQQLDGIDAAMNAIVAQETARVAELSKKAPLVVDMGPGMFGRSIAASARRQSVQPGQQPVVDAEDQEKGHKADNKWP